MASEWKNCGAANGLWFQVTNGEKTLELARRESADEAVSILNSLERDAAFGRQCVQDDCEGAWIPATVYKAECAKRDALLSALESILSAKEYNGERWVGKLFIAQLEAIVAIAKAKGGSDATH